VRAVSAVTHVAPPRWMGVTGLWALLDAQREYEGLCGWRGRTLAVDVSILLASAHKATAPPVAVAAFGAWSKRAWLDLPTDVKISRVLFRKIVALLAVGVRVVAVFDGPPPKLKAQRRGGTARRGAFRALRMGLIEPLLEAMGVPVVVAASEAEAECAYLEMCGLAQGTLSTDGDALLFGSRCLVTSVPVPSNMGGGADEEMVETAGAGESAVAAGTAATQMRFGLHVLRMGRVEARLGLWREHLVAHAIFSGCDYYDGVHGAGGARVRAALARVPAAAVFDVLATLAPTVPSAPAPPVATRKPPHCTRCQRPGSSAQHALDGGCAPVPRIATACDCAWHTVEARHGPRRDEHKRTQALRRLVARSVEATGGGLVGLPEFPPSEVLQLYMRPVLSRPCCRALRAAQRHVAPRLLQQRLQSLLYLSAENSRKSAMELALGVLLHGADYVSGLGPPVGGEQSVRGLLQPLVVRACVHRLAPVYETQWLLPRSAGASGAARPGMSTEGLPCACVLITKTRRGLLEREFPQAVACWRAALPSAPAHRHGRAQPTFNGIQGDAHPWSARPHGVPIGPQRGASGEPPRAQGAPGTPGTYPRPRVPFSAERTRASDHRLWAQTEPRVAIRVVVAALCKAELGTRCLGALPHAPQVCSVKSVAMVNAPDVCRRKVVHAPTRGRGLCVGSSVNSDSDVGRGGLSSVSLRCAKPPTKKRLFVDLT
jgi:hypothetical protein